MPPDDGGTERLTVLDVSVCAVDDVEFAVVFGSRITGEPTQASDLAVKVSDNLSEADRFEKPCFYLGIFSKMTYRLLTCPISSRFPLPWPLMP